MGSRVQLARVHRSSSELPLRGGKRIQSCPKPLTRSRFSKSRKLQFHGCGKHCHLTENSCLRGGSGVYFATALIPSRLAFGVSGTAPYAPSGAGASLYISLLF